VRESLDFTKSKGEMKVKDSFRFLRCDPACWRNTVRKSLFSAIVLAFALIAGYFFYSENLDTLEQEVEGITQEYNQNLF
jgi:hypothetical protein